MTIVRVQFCKKSIVLFKGAVFSFPAETTLFQLLDQIYSGMFYIFSFFSLYFVLFCGISMKYVERNTV